MATENNDLKKPLLDEEQQVTKKKEDEKPDQPILGFFMINCFVVGVVLTNMFYKEAMNEGMSAIEVGLWRSFICCITYAAFLKPFGQTALGDTTTEDRWMLILRAVIG